MCIRDRDNTVQALSVNKTFDIKQFFSPQSYIISFGGGIYTQNYSEENSALWAEVQSDLSTYLQTLESVNNIKSIDELRWVELVKSRAVRFRLPFNMALSDIQTMLDLESNTIENDIIVNSILISTHTPEIIYFANEDDNLFYEMSGVSLLANIQDYITKVENNTLIEYRRVEDLFGLGEALQNVENRQNNSIFPINSMRVDIVNVTPEVDVLASDDSGLKSFANKAFGKQFNFVKKMRDVDKSVIYLYGYANKALRLGADGSIEFTQRLEPNVKVESVDLGEAIRIALGYVDQYGGAPSSLYVADYSVVPDEKGIKSYTLEFDYRINDFSVLSDNLEDKHSVRVEITGNQVTNFKRKIHRFRNSFTLDIWKRALTINEVLERNSKIVQENYEKSLTENEELSNTEIWTRILSDISHVEQGYFLESNKEYMEPIWNLDIGSSSYSFRLYDGRLLRVQTN